MSIYATSHTRIKYSSHVWYTSHNMYVNFLLSCYQNNMHIYDISHINLCRLKIYLIRGLMFIHLPKNFEYYDWIDSLSSHGSKIQYVSFIQTAHGTGHEMKWNELWKVKPTKLCEWILFRITQKDRVLGLKRKDILHILMARRLQSCSCGSLGAISDMVHMSHENFQFLLTYYYRVEKSIYGRLQSY